jgi:succinate dehydrogenase/fumarate reductase-like Fe-S protein
MLQVSIYRFNPETDAAPQMQDYQVETGGKDLMVLDVLEMIKAEHDASVTYRVAAVRAFVVRTGLISTERMASRVSHLCLIP